MFFSPRFLLHGKDVYKIKGTVPDCCSVKPLKSTAITTHLTAITKKKLGKLAKYPNFIVHYQTLAQAEWY